MSQSFGWLSIVRLGLVQAALGAIVVLTTSTLNRVMVVELYLPALLPGLLVTLHHAMQILRPRYGHGSDVGGRHKLWILGGMALLAVGGFFAAWATTLISSMRVGGILFATAAFAMIGIGAGAAGTSILALLAKSVAPNRRGPAATVVWLMMIAGFAVTATVAGQHLEPFSADRLLRVAAWISTIAFFVSVAAIWGLDTGTVAAKGAGDSDKADCKVPFFVALASVWEDSSARGFTLFVFMSMLAYSMQDLILEPFAGAAFGMTPGQSTSLSGTQHAGVFVGMLLAALATRGGRGAGSVSLLPWVVGGCVASAAALFGLTAGSVLAPHWPLSASVFFLGLVNGLFAIAAIGAMMELANTAGRDRVGIRMGLWGAAQAIAFAAGGLLGAAMADVMTLVLGSRIAAYGVVFAAEALLFLAAARLALTVLVPQRGSVLRGLNTELRGGA